jgi:hypothetical protein
MCDMDLYSDTILKFSQDSLIALGHEYESQYIVSDDLRHVNEMRRKA